MVLFYIIRVNSASGFIIRYHSSNPLLPSSKNIGQANVMVAEEVAHGFRRIQIFGGWSLTIGGVNDKIQAPWIIKFLFSH